MKSLWVGILVGLVSIAACSSKSGTTEDHLDEQTGAGGCPTAPKIVVGTGAVGSTCTTAADCAPICCACTTGVGNWAAAECRNDKCDTVDACADTALASFCH
jgi:hypothetical protein